MAQYAYKYNDIFDDYLVQATPAPQKKPEVKPEPEKPQLKRIGRTKQQVIKENQRKFKIALAKISIIAAAFVAVVSMAVMSQAELKSTEMKLAQVNAAYQESLEENNQLKSELDKMLAKVDIDKIAKKQLGLQKIPEKRKLSVDMSRLTDSVYSGQPELQ